MNETIKDHIKGIRKLVEMGLFDATQAESEITDCTIGLKPCTFSVWCKRPEPLLWKGPWWCYASNITIKEVFELYLLGEIEDGDQVRPFNLAQYKLYLESK